MGNIAFLGQSFPLSFAWPIRLQYFSEIVAVALFVALGTLIVLMGTWSLTGMGPARRWVTISIRLVVLLLFILVLGGVRWQRRAQNVEVMVLQDISDSIYNLPDWPGKDAADEMHRRTLDESLNQYLLRLSADPTKRPDDTIGLIAFKDYAQVDAAPHAELSLDHHGQHKPGTGTNIGTAVELGMAMTSPDKMHRFVLISDGNANQGDTDKAIAAAAAQHIPIDVVPLKYNVTNDVSIERFVAPSWRREGEAFSLSVVLRNTNPVPVKGRLQVIHQTADGEEPVEAGANGREVELKPGPNVETFRVPPVRAGGIHRFRAVFTPDVPANGKVETVDAIEENDAADAVTFVKGRGRVLYVDGSDAPGKPSPGELLSQALGGVQGDAAQRGEGIDVHVIPVDQFPNNPIDLQNYDAVVLNNVSRGGAAVRDESGAEHESGLTPDQDGMLRTYVHDMGGGLVMIGGPETFGAGGWQGSELEKVLPVDMDIPAQRQMPKGALVLVMDPCEIPEGTYWGQQCATQAIAALSSQDEVGIVGFHFADQFNANTHAGYKLELPLGPKGDASAAARVIKTMAEDDMPSLDDAVSLALNGQPGQGPGLIGSNARYKHIIIISDGDPETVSSTTINLARANKISISTVTAYPHTHGDLPPIMKDIAVATGGKFYGPLESDPSKLPQIFIKEAMIVKRSLIQEPEGGIPITVRDAADEMIGGIAEFRRLRGMVLTSRKNDPKVEMPLSAGKMNDPILAHWQTGLGKSAVWTSDAHNKWSAAWVNSPDYAKLWSQIIRGVSRPPMSGDFEVHVNVQGKTGEVIVEAMNKDSGYLDFLNIGGTVAGGKDLKAPPQEVHLNQIGPGTYKATFETRGEGSYVAALTYRGKKGVSGLVMGAAVMIASPERQELQSNEVLMGRIAEATGGRVLEPFQPQGADLFARDGLFPVSSDMPVWELLLPVLCSLVLVDVAVRRIAWDWHSTKRMAFAAADWVFALTATRKVETRQSLEALRGIRERAAEAAATALTPGPAATPGASRSSASPPSVPRPDPVAKFSAAGVEGDITQVVGGATDKPIPPAPKRIEPKGGSAAAGGHMGGLMAAKKRAQQQIKDREQPDGHA